MFDFRVATHPLNIAVPLLGLDKGATTAKLSLDQGPGPSARLHDPLTFQVCICTEISVTDELVIMVAKSKHVGQGGAFVISVGQV